MAEQQNQGLSIDVTVPTPPAPAPAQTQQRVIFTDASMPSLVGRGGTVLRQRDADVFEVQFDGRDGTYLVGRNLVQFADSNAQAGMATPPSSSVIESVTDGVIADAFMASMSRKSVPGEYEVYRGDNGMGAIRPYTPPPEPTFMEQALDVAGDIGQGILRGVNEGVTNVANVVGRIVGIPGTDYNLWNLSNWLTENIGGGFDVQAPEGAAGNIAQGFAEYIPQLVVGYGGAGAAAKAIGGLSSWLQGTAAGAIADFLADPTDPTLGDLAVEIGEMDNATAEAVRQAFAETLARDGDDSELEARLKQVGGGLLAGAVIDGLIATYRGVRAARTAVPELYEGFMDRMSMQLSSVSPAEARARTRGGRGQQPEPEGPSELPAGEVAEGAIDPATYRNAPEVADGNKHRLMPYLRDYAPAAPRRDPKQRMVQKTTNANARNELLKVDEVLRLNPEAHLSVDAWKQMMADALGDQDVPIPPYRFISDINGQGSVQGLSRLTPGQIADADHGFENARAFREAYTSGQLGVETTGKLFLWSFLSRGVSPYTQESLFIDAFPGIGPWMEAAANGTFDADAYEVWAKSVAPAGRGQPGAGATHNLNAFGRDFLVKMSERMPDGRTKMQYLHDLMSDPNSTGKMIRREFAAIGEGVGIDNKVVSFTLLVAGFDDVMVLDRVQFRQLFNDGRYNGVNLYDGFKQDGAAVTGSGLAKQGDGAAGILIYEAIERGVQANIDRIYAELGRPGQGSVGRYHWETWVADSQQEASHGSLAAILPDALGQQNAIQQVTVKQGEYGSYAYGARYGVDGAGVPYFTYPTPSGKVFTFSVPDFVQFQQEIKKPANGVVPSGFKVTEAGNAPWYGSEAVNADALDRVAGRYGREAGAAGEGARAVRQDGGAAAVPDRPAAPVGAERARSVGGSAASNEGGGNGS